MDVKAAARSKHAASHRGRARHSSHKHAPKTSLPAQTPSSSSSDDKLQIEQQASRLPSNWDRYEEEEPPGLDARLSAPPVKSKGANYKDLLAEKSMYESPEFVNARKRLMHSKAQRILDQSATADDIWSMHGIFDNEDLFFSLDLKFLEQELAKVNIAERLFMDPKFILPEERDIKTSQDDSNKAEAEDNRVSESGNINQLSSTSISSPASSSHLEGRIQYGKVDLRGTEELEMFNRQEPGAHVKLVTASQEQSTDWSIKTDIAFERETAEAELDALLDMLDDHTGKERSASVSSILTGPNLNQQEISSTVVGIDVRNASGLEQLGNSFMTGITDDILVSAKEPGKPGDALNIEQHTRVETAVLSSQVPYECVSDFRKEGKHAGSGSVNQPVNLDDDFDNWLDSL